MRRPLTKAEVLIAIEELLRGGALESPNPSPPPDPSSSSGPFEGFAERVARFRLEPLGGRLLPFKRILYWFVASAFDRQTKIFEGLVEALHVERSRIAHLESQLAELRNRVALLEDRQNRGRPEP